MILSQQGTVDWLVLNPASRLASQIQNTRTGPLTAPTAITDGQWHRVGLVWDGSVKTLYIDDVEAARDVKALGAPPYATGGLHLGAGSKLEAGTFFSGLIDDVRIYNQVVTP